MKERRGSVQTKRDNHDHTNRLNRTRFLYVGEIGIHLPRIYTKTRHQMHYPSIDTPSPPIGSPYPEQHSLSLACLWLIHPSVPTFEHSTGYVHETKAIRHNRSESRQIYSQFQTSKPLLISTLLLLSVASPSSAWRPNRMLSKAGKSTSHLPPFFTHNDCVARAQEAVSAQLQGFERRQLYASPTLL